MWTPAAAAAAAVCGNVRIRYSGGSNSSNHSSDVGASNIPFRRSSFNSHYSAASGGSNQGISSPRSFRVDDVGKGIRQRR